MGNETEDPLYDNLNQRETEDLLDIWQNGDPADWQEDVFELIAEILQDRLGELPPASMKYQVKQRLEAAQNFQEAGELEKALDEVEQLLQLQPGLAYAHHLRGMLNEDLGDPRRALEDYQAALRLDLGLEGVRDDIRHAEKALEDEFLRSPVRQLLIEAGEAASKGHLDQARTKVELARQSLPETAQAHYELGDVLDEMDQPEDAIREFQTALSMDPELVDARESLLEVEEYLEAEFQQSDAKRLLDQALGLIPEEQPEQALRSCMLARESLPPIALAHNFLGLILIELGQFELAVGAFLQAVKLNPWFFAARQNLAEAQILLEQDEYRRAVRMEPEETIGLDAGGAPDELQDFGEAWKDTPIPGWMYRGEPSLHLIGWPGYRTRPGRSGYDPLEVDFEQAHMKGVVFRRLLTFRFRTRDPLNLLVMTSIGLIYSPALFLFAIVNSKDLNSLFLLITMTPYWIAGILLLVNAAASLGVILNGEEDPDGHEFF